MYLSVLREQSEENVVGNGVTGSSTLTLKIMTIEIRCYRFIQQWHPTAKRKKSFNAHIMYAIPLLPELKTAPLGASFHSHILTYYISFLQLCATKRWNLLLCRII